MASIYSELEPFIENAFDFIGRQIAASVGDDVDTSDTFAVVSALIGNVCEKNGMKKTVTPK